MIASAARTPSWLWFTPMVHQNETRSPAWMVAANRSSSSGPTPVVVTTRSRS